MKKLTLIVCLAAGTLSAVAQGDNITPNSVRTNYIGVGTAINTTFSLSVGGVSRYLDATHFGDWYDDTPYGRGIQICRPAAGQTDGRHYLSFVRAGQWVTGMGFVDNNTFGIVHSSSNTSSNGIFIAEGGKIGINNRTPTLPLDVVGDAKISGSSFYMNSSRLYSDANNTGVFTNGNYIINTLDNSATRAMITNEGKLWLYDGTNSRRVLINPRGDSFFNNGGLAVGFDVLPTGFKMAVNGVVGATKLKVTQTWADYVFADDYKLPSLAEVEAHIKANHTLPDIPSEQVIAKDGLDVGEMQKLQMQKIEELTLYIIEMKKQMEAQQEEINALKKK